MTLYIAAFAASFCMVFLKAFQQLNVMRDQRMWVVPTSYGMAAAEAWIIFQVADSGWGFLIVAVIGTGAWIGALCGMSLHRRLRNEQKRAG